MGVHDKIRFRKRNKPETKIIIELHQKTRFKKKKIRSVLLLKALNVFLLL